MAEDVEDVAHVALGAVGDKDLVGDDVAPAGLVIMLGDGLAEEVATLLIAVPLERLAPGHLIDGLVHRRDHSGHERLGHVADAAADDLGGRIRGGEGLHAAADFGEEVAGL